LSTTCHTEEEDEEYDSDNDDDDDIRTWPLVKEHDLRNSILYYWLCAVRAHEIAPKICPNIHWMMGSDLPLKYEPLRSCWPDHFVLDFSKQYEDCKFHVPWRYRQPPSLEEWLSYATESWSEYDIQDIPWYRDWYPAPVTLNPRNLLASLPPNIFTANLLPHLSFQDLKMLSLACPALWTRVMESLRPPPPP
jgi:hypothetical protein